MEGPAAPERGSPQQRPLPGSGVTVLLPAPVGHGEATDPQVVNGAQGKHPSTVALVGQPAEAGRVGGTGHFRQPALALCWPEAQGLFLGWPSPTLSLGNLSPTPRMCPCLIWGSPAP